MNICVVGTGYVGLVAGACLSDFGMNVICVDKDKSKIDTLKNGVVPIHEIGLTDLIESNVKRNHLSFTIDLEGAIKKSQCIFIGVGTPENEDGTVNLSYVYEVADTIAASMQEYKVIIMKSTVPVGTAKKLREYIKSKLTHDVEFDIVSNPEFLREGTAVEDFLHPDRVVIGSDSEKALRIVKDLYQPVYLQDMPILCTSNETAELIKYAANTVLALKISYINEIANLCDKTGADVTQVATAIGLDERIGSKFLHAGPGFGGSCFPKDVFAFTKIAQEHNYEFKIAQAIREVNQRQKEIVIEKSLNLLGGFEGKTVTILGLAFKPNTDDVREAPALYIAERFLDSGAIVNAFDPIAMEEAKKNIVGLNYFDDAYDACENSDLLLIVTEWNEFRDLDFKKIKSLMRTLNIYDTRNIYTPSKITSLGFNYICTGRPVE